MKDKKEQKDKGAKSSWSLEEIEELFDKHIKLAKKEFDILRFASLMTPEFEKAYREASIDADVLKNLRKKGQQVTEEEETLREQERERRRELKRACIRNFLGIGRELKKSDPESKLFNLSVELLDYLDRIESDLHSLSGYEWRKLDTGLDTYVSLLRGEAEKRCKKASAEKPAETKQDIPPTIFRRIWTGIKGFIKEAYRITIKSFFDSAMNK